MMKLVTTKQNQSWPWGPSSGIGKWGREIWGQGPRWRASAGGRLEIVMLAEGLGHGCHGLESFFWGSFEWRFSCATCARRRRKSPRARGGVLNSACWEAANVNLLKVGLCIVCIVQPKVHICPWSECMWISRFHIALNGTFLVVWSVHDPQLIFCAFS